MSSGKLENGGYFVAALSVKSIVFGFFPGFHLQ